jgi:arginase
MQGLMNQFIYTPYFLDRPLTAFAEFFPRDARTAGGVMNAPALSGDDEQGRMISYHAPLAGYVADAVRAGARPVAISGDCCATIPVLAGLQQAGVQPVLLWFDAHGDFNTWETTPSKFLGGMPLAMMCGLGEQRMMHGSGAAPLGAHQVILTDGRDLDPGEKINVKDSGVLHLDDIDTLLIIRIPNRPIWVHFDTDVLNLTDMSAAKYPAQGGPDTAAVTRVMQRIAATGRVAAVSMTPWAFDMDPQGVSARNCMTVLEALL